MPPDELAKVFDETMTEVLDGGAGRVADQLIVDMPAMLADHGAIRSGFEDEPGYADDWGWSKPLFASPKHRPTFDDLETIVVERHDQALADMIDMVDARLSVLAMAGAPALADVDMAAVRRRITAARRALDDGIAGYVLMVAVRP